MKVYPFIGKAWSSPGFLFYFNFVKGEKKVPATQIPF